MKIILIGMMYFPKSYAIAILGAEYLVRMVPRGTHDWRKFIKPDDIKMMIEQTQIGKTNQMKVMDMSGLVMNPSIKCSHATIGAMSWSLSSTDLDVNYILHAIKSTE